MALSDERLPDDILGMLDPGGARVARTASRRILSFMNDSAARAATPSRIRRSGTHDLDDLNRRLRRQLHDHDGYRQPLDSVLDRLAA